MFVCVREIEREVGGGGGLEGVQNIINSSKILLKCAKEKLIVDWESTVSASKISLSNV